MFKDHGRSSVELPYSWQPGRVPEEECFQTRAWWSQQCRWRIWWRSRRFQQSLFPLVSAVQQRSYKTGVTAIEDYIHVKLEVQPPFPLIHEYILALSSFPLSAEDFLTKSNVQDWLRLPSCAFFQSLRPRLTLTPDVHWQHPVQQFVCLGFLSDKFWSSLGDNLLQMVCILLHHFDHVVHDVDFSGGKGSRK